MQQADYLSSRPYPAPPTATATAAGAATANPLDYHLYHLYHVSATAGGAAALPPPPPPPPAPPTASPHQSIMSPNSNSLTYSATTANNLSDSLIMDPRNSANSSAERLAAASGVPFHSISNLAAPSPASSMAAAAYGHAAAAAVNPAMRYGGQSTDPLGHHHHHHHHHMAAAAATQHLYGGYGAFDSPHYAAQMPPTTHIPLNTVGPGDHYSSSPPTSSSSSSGGSSSASSSQRMYPARPQPTRPVIMNPTTPKEMGPPPSSPSARSHPISSVSSPLYNPTPTPSLTAAAAAASSKDKVNNNNSNNNNSSSNNNFNNNSSSSPAAPSPAGSLGPMSPAAAAAAAASSASKYRFPSGGPTSLNPTSSVQSNNASVCSPPGLRGGATTPSSALSSREGTPLPVSVKVEEPAPNVDISTVQIKEIQAQQQQQLHVAQQLNQGSGSSSNHGGNEFSPPAAVSSAPSPSSSAFAHASGFHSQFAMRPGSSSSSTGVVANPHHLGGSARFGSSNSFFTHVGPSSSTATAASMDLAGDSSSLSGHSVTLPQRVGGASGRSASGPSVTGAANTITTHHHGHVKIGRRPAHLPKVLKFSDKTLPQGWIRKLKQRKHGKQAGRWDVYIYSPCGVKFASRKKLKGFFEKNNLTHDPEEFDFTPYGRHIDSRVANNSGDSSNTSGRHNSAGSTGSDGTHPGSSPASISNYSPTHPSGGYVPPTNMAAVSSHCPTTAAVAASAALGIPSGSYPSEYVSSFSQFDPHMENPPNASALDIPNSEFANPNHLGSLSYLSAGGGSNSAIGGRGGHHHHHPMISKDSVSVSEFFSPEMTDTDILGNSTGAGPHNGYGGGYGADLRNSNSLHPMSNVSVGSRTSEEADNDINNPMQRHLNLQQSQAHHQQQQQQQQQQHQHHSSNLNKSLGGGLDACGNSILGSSGSVTGSLIGNSAMNLDQQQMAGGGSSNSNSSSVPGGSGVPEDMDASSQQDKGFSLRGTMSVLHSSQDGFVDGYYNNMY